MKASLSLDNLILKRNGSMTSLLGGNILPIKRISRDDLNHCKHSPISRRLVGKSHIGSGEPALNRSDCHPSLHTSFCTTWSGHGATNDDSPGGILVIPPPRGRYTAQAMPQVLPALSHSLAVMEDHFHRNTRPADTAPINVHRANKTLLSSRLRAAHLHTWPFRYPVKIR